MEFYYPVRQPINQSNLFGTPGPIYTASKQKGHPGVDFECPTGTPIYAPCDGGAFYVTDFNALVKEGLIEPTAVPESAGCGIWIRTPNNAEPLANIILWHMHAKDTPGFPYSIPTDGSVTQVKAGDLLGYSADSGYPIETNGAHCHFGYMPCDNTGESLSPDNGYLGCENPMPFFNGQYADEISAIPAAVTPVVQEAAAIIPEIASSPATPEQKETLLEEVEEVVKDVEEIL